MKKTACITWMFILQWNRIGFVGLEVFAVPFAGLFGLSGETKTLCISAIRIISVSFMFAGANIAFQGIF